VSSEPAACKWIVRRCFRKSLCVLLLLGCVGLPLGCSRPHDDGLEKFPVTGQVQVDGEPAEGVVVRFFRDGKTGTTNADTPLAVTQEDGRFELSTNGDGDGAVAGNYRVTFTWKIDNSPGSKDRLGGKYTKLEKSEFDVTVRQEPTDLKPFLLETPADNTTQPARPRGRTRSNPNAPAAGAVR
jgi:hypothetical protein